VDSSFSYDYKVNPALDVVARKRYMYRALDVAGFAQIRTVFSPAVMFRDNLLGNLVEFEFFIMILALFLLLCGGFLWHTSVSFYSVTLQISNLPSYFYHQFLPELVPKCPGLLHLMFSINCFLINLIERLKEIPENSDNQDF
jgi:hypothetical protein